MDSPNYIPNFWLTNPGDEPKIEWDEMNLINDVIKIETDDMNAADTSSSWNFTQNQDLSHVIFNGSTVDASYSKLEDTSSFIDDSSPPTIYSNPENVLNNVNNSDLNDSGFDEDVKCSTNDLSSSSIYSNPKNLLEGPVGNILENKIECSDNRKNKKNDTVKRSSLTYIQMIFLAIYNSPTGIVPLKEIYKYMSSNFTSLSYGIKWHNSVRNVLSRKGLFRRVSAINGKPVTAYRVVDNRIVAELKKSIQNVIEKRGYNSLGMTSKAPIEGIYAMNRTFLLNKLIVQKYPHGDTNKVPSKTVFVVPTDLFKALRDHSFEVEMG